MAAAELPGQPHQPGRVLGAHLEKILRGRPHRDEPAVVEAQGVAVLEGCGLREGHVEKPRPPSATRDPDAASRAAWSRLTVSATRSARTAALRTIVVAVGMGPWTWTPRLTPRRR